MKVPKTNFKDLSFNLSNYCISSCKYCNLCSPSKWNIKDEMNMREIESFLIDPILKNLKTIHLTGGEPFLSPKFLSVIDIMYEHYRDIPANLPTNALYPNLIYRLMKMVYKKIPQLKLNIGLEGPNKKVHEAIRGKGSWKPMIETIRRLKPLGVSMAGNITLFKENYHYIRETKALCDKLGIGFYLNFGRFSIRFDNEKDGIRYDLAPMIDEIELAIKDIGWLKARKFNKQKWIIQKAVWEGKKVHWNCLAGIEGIDILPNGDVSPCLMYYEDYRFGNIRDASKRGIWSKYSYQPLSHIMNRERAKEIQKRIYRGDCSSTCPFTCQLRMENLRIDSRKIKI